MLHEMNADLSVLHGRLQVAAMRLDPTLPGSQDVRDAIEIIRSLCAAVRGLWLQSSPQETIVLDDLARRTIQSVAGNGRVYVEVQDATAIGFAWRAERVIANLLRNALSASETASLKLCSTWNQKAGLFAEVTNMPTRATCTKSGRSTNEPRADESVPHGLGLRLCKALSEEVGGSFELRVTQSGEFIATAWFPNSQTG